MRVKSLLLAVIAASSCFGTAHATIDLTFEGINPSYTESNPEILDFYNGGTSSAGTSGTNYGISFPSTALAICLNVVGSVCSNTSRGGIGDPGSTRGGLFFLSGGSTILDDPAGFDTGFSFNYAAINQGGFVKVYSGLEGTGTLLATLTLPTTPSTCPSNYSAGFCPFVASGTTFAGKAQSIDFGGSANQIVFDDVTFGSAIPGLPIDVPEPATVALVGLALAGLTARRMAKRRG